MTMDAHIWNDAPLFRCLSIAVDRNGPSSVRAHERRVVAILSLSQGHTSSEQYSEHERCESVKDIKDTR